MPFLFRLKLHKCPIAEPKLGQKVNQDAKFSIRDYLSFHPALLKCKCQNSPKVHGALTENKEETFLPSTCMKPHHVVYSVAALKMEGGWPQEKPRTASTVMAVWVWPLVDGF